MTRYEFTPVSKWLLSLVMLGAFLPGSSEAICLKKKSYEDCLLEGLKGTTSDIAAQAIKRACAEKFPSKAKRSLRLSSPSATTLITGTASIGYGSLSGKLYNGSPFYLSGVTLMVQPKGTDANGEKPLGRRLAIKLDVPQNSTDSFCISVDDAFENAIRSGFDWSIVDIFVIKEE